MWAPTGSHQIVVHYLLRDLPVDTQVGEKKDYCCQFGTLLASFPHSPSFHEIVSYDLWPTRKGSKVTINMHTEKSLEMRLVYYSGLFVSYIHFLSSSITMLARHTYMHACVVSEQCVVDGETHRLCTWLSIEVSALWVDGVEQGSRCEVQRCGDLIPPPSLSTHSDIPTSQYRCS